MAKVKVKFDKSKAIAARKAKYTSANKMAVENTRPSEKTIKTIEMGRAVSPDSAKAYADALGKNINDLVIPEETTEKTGTSTTKEIDLTASDLFGTVTSECGKEWNNFLDESGADHDAKGMAELTKSYLNHTNKTVEAFPASYRKVCESMKSVPEVTQYYEFKPKRAVKEIVLSTLWLQEPGLFVTKNAVKVFDQFQKVLMTNEPQSTNNFSASALTKQLQTQGKAKEAYDNLHKEGLSFLECRVESDCVEAWDAEDWPIRFQTKAFFRPVLILRNNKTSKINLKYNFQTEEIV